MPTEALEKIEKLLTQLTGQEKREVLQRLFQDLYFLDPHPRITSTPEVCGGEACIVRTRIPVWLLVQAKRLGASDAQLLQSYPALDAEDLANAWAYARQHAEELSRQIAAHEAA